MGGLSLWTVLVLSADSCPTNVQPMLNLDLTKYKGDWYVMYRTAIGAGLSSFSQCNVIRYDDHPEGLSFISQSLFGEYPNLVVDMRTGYMRQPDG